jgi:flagellar protein FliS
MRSNPYRAYVEDEILTADPVKLVQMLYRGAMEAVADARAKLAMGDIKGRSAAVTKAVEILAELSSSLDHERGGELSASLAALYDFAQRRLLAGNQEQADRPLAEAGRVLETLGEAWMGLAVPSPGRAAGQPERVPLSCAY